MVSLAMEYDVDKTLVIDVHAPNSSLSFASDQFGRPRHTPSVTAAGDLVLKDSKLVALPRELLVNLGATVLHLDLRDNQLVGLEEDVACLRHLEVLDLRGNRLESLPSSINQLTRLKTLRADSNSLSSLPSSLGDLSLLEFLTLSDNHLFCLPSSIGHLSSLKTLSLQGNTLRYLPAELGELGNLSVLHLHGNSLSTLPTTLQHLECLREFSLEWFRYTSPPLPRNLKGHIGEAMIGSLKTLFGKLYRQRTRECKLVLFLEHFSEEKFDINRVDGKSKSALHTAAAEGDLGVMYGLIEAGIDVNLRDKDDCSALLLAIKDEKTRAVKLLLEAGASVSGGGGAVGSPLHLATYKHETWLVKELIRRGADVNSRDCEGNTPLHIVLGVFNKNKRKCASLAEALLAAGAHVNALNNENWAPIHLAARRGQTEAIKWLIYQNSKLSALGREKFDIDYQGGVHLWTSLHLSGHAGHFDIVRILVEAGAKVFLRNSDGRTPKQASKSDLALFKYLIRAERETLRKQVSSASWQATELSEEPKTVHREEVSEALDDKQPLWRRYTALYTLYESRDSAALLAVYEAVKREAPFLQELVYMLGQLRETEALPALEALQKDPSERSLVQEEAMHASKHIKGAERGGQTFMTTPIGPKLHQNDRAMRASYSVRSLATFGNEDTTKKDQLLLI